MRCARLLVSVAFISNAALSPVAFAAAKRVQPARTPATISASAGPHSPTRNRSTLLRQDLFDRGNPSNERTDWPAPPAQPGQF